MLTHWHHFNQLLNDFADTAARQVSTPATGTCATTLWAAADIHETDEALTLTMDVPGLRSEDVEIVVEDRVLKVSGVRHRPEVEGAVAHRRERRFGRFDRSFRLGTTLDASGTVANVVDGLLTVTVPKSAESKRVQVQVS
ncbi:MAG: Hsp20/alpha crystallin family protein [Myxococcota bacterium]|jgi:HSP20 family protein|nr:Hsp20/alpha crystallin family protein [Myxococcota bacterium]